MIKSMLLTFCSFLCTSWLLMRAMELYTQCQALLKLQHEQKWLLQQCSASYAEISKYADCDNTFRIANTSTWHIVRSMDQAFFVFPALSCCILWIGLVLKSLYK